MREFYFDEKELKCEKDEMRKLASDKKQQYVSKLQVVRIDFCAPLADCLPSCHMISLLMVCPEMLYVFLGSQPRQFIIQKCCSHNTFNPIAELIHCHNPHDSLTHELINDLCLHRRLNLKK